MECASLLALYKENLTYTVKAGASSSTPKIIWKESRGL